MYIHAQTHTQSVIHPTIQLPLTSIYEGCKVLLTTSLCVCVCVRARGFMVRVCMPWNVNYYILYILYNNKCTMHAYYVVGKAETAESLLSSSPFMAN